MNSFKKYFLIPLLAAVGVFLILSVAVWSVTYLQFICADRIETTRIDETPVEITIPIKFHSTDLTDLPGIPLYTKNKGRYTLRCVPEKDILWITVSRMGYISVYTARFEVPDPKIRRRLMDIWEDHTSNTRCRKR